MELKTRCIVLRTVKYGDNRLIADLLSREGGRLSVAVKSSGRGRGGASRQLFQPLTILDAEYFQGAHQSLGHLREVRIAEVYTSIPYDGIKMSLVFFLAEFLTQATRNMNVDPMLYDFVEQSLLWLDTTESSVANFHLMFMVRLTRFLGFMPDVGGYHNGWLFDLREGSFCGSVPTHSDFVGVDDAAHLQLLMRITAANMHLFRMSRAERNRITDLVLRFYRIHFSDFNEMKSLEVLREF